MALQRQLTDLLGKQIETSFGHSDGVVFARPKHNQVVTCADGVSITTFILISIADADAVGSASHTSSESVIKGFVSYLLEALAISKRSLSQV